MVGHDAVRLSLMYSALGQFFCGVCMESARRLCGAGAALVRRVTLNPSTPFRRKPFVCACTSAAFHRLQVCSGTWLHLLAVLICLFKIRGASCARVICASEDRAGVITARSSTHRLILLLLAECQPRLPPQAQLRRSFAKSASCTAFADELRPFHSEDRSREC